MEQYLNYILIDDKNPFSNPNGILTSTKSFYTKATNVLSCHCWTYNKTKIWTKQFHQCGDNIFLEIFLKSINSQTNIKSSGNDSLTAKLYIRVSNELSAIL